MTLLAVFAVWLHRQSGDEDIVIGSPMANRNRIDVEGMIGLFANTVALRVSLNGSLTFAELLARVRLTALDAYRYQEMPLDRLVETLQLERELGRNPLFQVMFNLVNMDGMRGETSTLRMEKLPNMDPDSKFDFTLYAVEYKQGLSFRVVYNGSLFSPQRMEEMLVQLERLCIQATHGIDQELRHLSLAPEPADGDIAKATDLSSVDSLPIPERFIEQAQRTPDRVALVDAVRRWTYRELELSSRAVAAELVEKGLCPGDVAAIVADRSVTTPTAILGAMRAGCAFMILDPAYPAARLERYLALGRPKIIIDGRSEPGDGWQPDRQSTELIAVRDLPARDVPFLIQSIRNDSLAYLAFTSGSSGEPKLIASEHGPLSHFFEWYLSAFAFDQDDRFSALSGLSHDPFLRDVFTPLCIGASVYLPSQPAVAPEQLTRELKEQRVSVAHVTPALISLLAGRQDCELPHLRRVHSGGDRLTFGHLAALRSFAPNATCVNFYGATETPQVAAWHAVKLADLENVDVRSSVPIGVGIDGFDVAVTTESGARAGVGEVGEILVRTTYLARGYLHDPVLTRDRFLPDPWDTKGKVRAYRTGDLGRYRPDGALEFVGRVDRQVKVRGYRVELEEVECTIADHPDVQRSVVLPGESDQSSLVAYVVCSDPNAEEALWEWTSQRLPDYMTPVFVILDEVPLTANGKVDTTKLRALGEGQPTKHSEFVGPSTPIEESLAEIWTELLSVDQVDVRKNFFQIGGHSLSATQMATRIRDRFDVDFSVRSVFTQPTIKDQAHFLRTLLLAELDEDVGVEGRVGDLAS